MTRTHFLNVTLSITFFIFALSARAAPDLSKPVGPTIADTGSAVYHFETLTTDSADGQRHYRITLATPNSPAPAKGYPLLFLLDGNAALADLDDTFLQSLDENPPALVFLGYQTDLRFDVKARAQDYTPADRDGNTQYGRWQGGGAAEFLDFLTSSVKTDLASKLSFDDNQTGIWGHSFGGLFVLYALQQHEDVFHYFASADPALWWMDGELMETLRQYDSSHAPAKQTQVLLMHGEKKKPAREQDANRNPTGAPRDTTKDYQTLVENLDSPDTLDARYQGYPLTHGPLFSASLKDTIQWFDRETSK